MNICPHKPLWTSKPVYGAYPLYLESNLRRCQLKFLSSSTFQAAKPSALQPVWILRALILVGDQPLQLMS